MEEQYESVIALEDMCLISCLVVLGFPVLTLNYQKYPQVSFHFGKSKRLEETMESFFNGSLLIEPKSFWATVRELKARIKSIKN